MIPNRYNLLIEFQIAQKIEQNSPPSNLFEFKMTSTEEVLIIIKECYSQSSAGIASFPAVLIKECAHVICSPLTKIFNSCILSNYMPNEWKTAIAVPLFKKGAVDDPNCYRSISLLAPVAKFYEKILADRVQFCFKFLCAGAKQIIGCRHRNP